MKTKHFIYILFIFLFNALIGCSGNNRHSKLSQISHESFLLPKLLNSERIKIKFGNYNVKVLNQNSKLRISNLYSLHDGKKITRTLAIVKFTETIDSTFIKEHLKILSGQSIGETFKKNQWRIEKKSLYFGEILPQTDFTETYKIMGNINHSKLAIYIYEFNITKDNNSHQYAIISEIYHPEYLTFDNLRKINKNAGKHLEKTNFIQELLELAENKMKINYNKLQTDHTNIYKK
ncbi:hypothetical protein [Aquimarina algiphila]|uniref:hypothetical protein n=1 Tax=Aquimarina algiphila TaxID=2047982 RepID=UPI00232D1A58|nr:hypothetical protein [Aquimarina algiphila]